MHSALSIQEILQCIFQHADEPSIATAARVCRTWSEPALNRLWKKTGDRGLVPLLELLSPPLGQGSIGRTFSREPTFPDWRRFREYAKRVQRIKYNDTTSKASCRIEASLFDSIAYLRPNAEALLPTITAVGWTCHPKSLRRVWLFATSTLTELSVSIPSQYTEGQLNADETLQPAEAIYSSSFLREIPLRLPNLTDLRLLYRSPIGLVEEAIIEAIRGLPKLECFRTQAYGLTPKIFNELSRLPRMKKIYTYWAFRGDYRGKPEDITDFDGTGLPDNAFPSLGKIYLDATLTNSIRLVRNLPSPKALTALWVTTFRQESLTDVKEIFKVIPCTCPDLKWLGIELFIREPPYSEAMEMAHLRPILGCKTLVNLSVRHNLPLKLSIADIHEIARSMPQLETLRLTEDPIVGVESVDTSPMLTLAALLPVAEHCPNLKCLGLFIDATKTADLPPVTSTFQKLEELYVGTSPITTKPKECLPFLADICPKNLTIKHDDGRCWSPRNVLGLPNGVRSDILKPRQENWDKLQEMHQMVVFYRQRNPLVRRLQEEIAKLKGELSRQKE